MRRKDRETSKEDAYRFADKCEYAVLSMLDGKNMPYCVPISIARSGTSIYFHSAVEGLKVDCLRFNPNVCLACVGDTERAKDKFTTKYESAIIRGIATEVTDAVEKINALKLLCERHTPTNMPNFDAAIAKSLLVTSVWQISITDISGKCKK